MLKGKNIPKLVIKVIYKSKDGNWRGFCYPFDVSCTAKTSKEAKKILENLVDVYIDGLKKYNFPSHIAVKEISDKEDKKVFKKVLTLVIKDIGSKMKKDLEKFQLNTKTNAFQIDNIRGRALYSFLPDKNLANC